MRYTHLFADENGEARFEDLEAPSRSVDSTLEFSEWFPVSRLAIARAEQGRERGTAPEPRRNWVVCISGSCEITASGETRTFRPGAVLLAEDTVGTGHSSFTRTGYTAIVIALD